MLASFLFSRNLYFDSACVIFLFVLIFQEAYRTSQVCVFSHQYSLELSEPSNSVDTALFSSQMNYLLYLIIAFLPSVPFYLSEMCIIFIKAYWMCPTVFFLSFRIYITLYCFPCWARTGIWSQMWLSLPPNNHPNCLSGKKWCICVCLFACLLLLSFSKCSYFYSTFISLFQELYFNENMFWIVWLNYIFSLAMPIVMLPTGIRILILEICEYVILEKDPRTAVVFLPWGNHSGLSVWG